MQILTYLILLVLIVAFYIWLYRSIHGKRIVVSLVDQRMYGWYDDKIMVSKSFDRGSSSEAILEIKLSLEKELDEIIKKYKQINK